MQGNFIPGYIIVVFKDDVKVEEAAAYLEREITPVSAVYDWRDHPQMGVLHRVDIYVAPGVEDAIREKLKNSGLVIEIVRMLRVEPVTTDKPKKEIVVTDKPKKEIDHEWLAKQLGAEIVGRVEGPIFGMAGAENLTRYYLRRMHEKK